MHTSQDWGDSGKGTDVSEEMLRALGSDIYGEPLSQLHMEGPTQNTHAPPTPMALAASGPKPREEARPRSAGGVLSQDRKLLTGLASPSWGHSLSSRAVRPRGIWAWILSPLSCQTDKGQFPNGSFRAAARPRPHVPVSAAPCCPVRAENSEAEARWKGLLTTGT